MVRLLSLSLSLYLALSPFTIIPHPSPNPLTAKDFKAVSGHNKYMGSLEGVTTVEKEKFPRHFWPDVSMNKNRETSKWP